MKPNETEGNRTRTVSLTGKQGNVLALLVGGQTIDASARANDIRPATVHDWLRNKPEFREAYDAALSDVIGHSSAILKASCAVAVTTLRGIAEDATAPAAPRVSAARSILELAYRAREQEEIIARIEKLENLTP
jgi:hypothetical protein